ncbi:CvpA family protein [Psychrosphaera haliotis]|uniref:Bacteriocin production protein n=1 Tax=Psychrosphaera haliotis TaxID=555083 RepID=A0A6N8F7G3_9GAMM|nr:CvpA family protein [Psychrosphaera haliotis]MUH72114.1 bacteriocin production protein [Psychrosphaera haliotis]
MVWIDYAIIAIIAISSLVSLVRGFVKESVSLAVWVGAFFVASQFYPYLASYLTGIEKEMVRNGSAIAILFIITLILGAMVNHILSEIVQFTGLTGTDKMLGMIFGGLRGALIVAATLLFLDTLTPSSDSLWWQNSILIPEFAFIVEWFFELLKENSSLLSTQP